MKFIARLLFLCAAILVVVLALANRHDVVFNLDPFSADNPALSFKAPLFLVLMIAVGVGILLNILFNSFGSARRWLHKKAKSGKTAPLDDI